MISQLLVNQFTVNLVLPLGISVLYTFLTVQTHTFSSRKKNAQFVPKQEFLCQWARLLPSFMDKMKSAITVSDCSDASKLFHRVLLVPVTNDSLPFLFTGTGDDLTLTILQRAIQDNVHHLHRFTTAQVKNNKLK